MLDADASENKNFLKKMWLLGFCLLVLLIISVGGLTRLTRSGLSIVEWRPITGIIPPLSDQAWQTQFELYKSSPEFHQVNSHFDIHQYKNIFLWEYAHRLLGRIIFLFVVIPGLILWRKKIVSGRFVAMLAGLVALQGVIGWLMVKTGLSAKPQVSPYMLALHFFSALAVLVIAYYQFLKIQVEVKILLNRMQANLLKIFGILLGLQIFYGCLTSGFKAGYGYNTYPLMNGKFFPADGLFHTPAVINFFENTATIQWMHRWLGILVLSVLIGLVFSFRTTPIWQKFKKSVFCLFGLTAIQVFLGVLNIIYVVPISLASLHQLFASFLVLAYFNLVFRAQFKPQVPL